MCGRFSMAIDSDDLRTALALGAIPTDWRKRYNIAPSQDVGVVIDPEERNVEWMRWGLVPFWAKDPEIGNRMINARAETIMEKPSFKQSFQKRRCLIPADGFFEWKKPTGSEKSSRPFYYSHKDGGPFFLAGLWDSWSPKEKGKQTSEALKTFTIITCPANSLVSQVHDRMPVVLTGDQAWNWLEWDNEAALASLLKPASEDLLNAHEVSRAVNKPENDSSDCITPITP